AFPDLTLRRSLLALRALSPTRLRLLVMLALASMISICSSQLARSQQTSPVERQVTNPITDTPNVNPLQQDQPVRPRLPTTGPAGQSSEQLEVSCIKETKSGPKGAEVWVCEGNVDARIGTYRLQADKVTGYDATNKVVAEGNVVF